MKLFAIKDHKSGIFLQPNFQKSIPDALRSWEIISNEGDSMVSRFPNDFRLYHLGDFDEQTGEISILAHPSDLGSAADFKRAPDAPLPFPKAN